MPDKVVGFTGSRVGMTGKQRRVVRTMLKGASEAHHGDCVGADAQFHELCVELEVPVVIHPPSNSKLRAYCKGAKRTCKPKEYIARNHDIVDASTVLVATPKETTEPPPARGQGTWSTIRYARSSGRKLKIAWR